jgi:hypothetical protein
VLFVIMTNIASATVFIFAYSSSLEMK